MVETCHSNRGKIWDARDGEGVPVRIQVLQQAAYEK